ncbi:uncharacterized protein I206_101733 [Kwoniella pini CBS 10737]|uniref:CCD97-like C-terminal domain-containing protein n=1 Tax=Kwoniella pini CBS 10737 TaxID=1296096 RepID=A0A1B9HVV3_9TREE|nr:uncharacterized protein I206_06299 [Kwoniella pini CBS 10737]OCF47402.1 hypothetical protein I206_06299 [Kwoniella pini CBS 10737]
MSDYPLSKDQVHQILSYLDLPITDVLPLQPLEFLNKYILNLPQSILKEFIFLSPKQLTNLSIIKHRRLLYSTKIPKPNFLLPNQGRLRWPLLWENLGGDPNINLNDNSLNAIEEEQWVSNKFMNPISIINNDNDNRISGIEEASKRQHVKKLGGFLRVLEEERESESVRAAKRMERRLNTLGEEFDDESDEEDIQPFSAYNNGVRVEIKEDQGEVERVFEKRILELFLDGLDTIDYTEIDFIDPPDGDPIAIRDAEDRYFDDEEPSETSDGHEATQTQTDTNSDVKSRLEEIERAESIIPQNGQGEYDY